MQSKQGGFAKFSELTLIPAGIIWLVALYRLCKIPQYDFTKIFLLFSLAFGAYYYIIRRHHEHWKVWLAWSLIAKIFLLFLFPMLSDDVYRFQFDGLLTRAGENPYGVLPEEYFKDNRYGFPGFLIEKMNSPGYYTIYPPAAQYIYALAAWTKDIVWFSFFSKLIYLGIEIIGLVYLVRILKQMDKSPSIILWFALNPLVIVEGYGNLHIEVVMVSLLAIFYYYFLTEKMKTAGFFFALAVNVKLLPLILLPLLVFTIQRKARKYFILSITITSFVIVLPFVFSEGFFTFLHSIDLFFRSFEFNGSVYAVLRLLGIWLSGYNLIQYVGPLLALISLGIILRLSTIFARDDNREKQLTGMLVIWTVYLLLATTVHPWYVIPVVLFGMLTGNIYPLVWSYVVVMSYHFYGNNSDNFHTFLWVLQYMILFGFIRKSKVIEDIKIELFSARRHPF
jgi:alpha-1,6-mannosyltransferase